MKHAYLILAHNEPELLKILLSRLDNENNDIYIHIDKKSSIDKKEIAGVLKKSEIRFIESINVGWGRFDITKCEIELLKEALKKHHDYYHMLSGVCLPVKSLEYIEDYFEKHSGEEFVEFDPEACKSQKFITRISRYHFSVPSVSVKGLKKKLIDFINFGLKVFGKVFSILMPNKLRKYKNIRWMKGSSFFDITEDCAKFVIENEKMINKIFKFSSCADEMFIHTLVYNSRFKDKISDKSLRYIDWHNHGKSPEILSLEHFENFKDPDKLYARKFSLEKSPDVIFKVLEQLS